MQLLQKKKKKSLQIQNNKTSYSSDELEFSRLISKMTASYKIKWVGICFYGNPAHPDQGTSFGVEAGCVFTCHHTTGTDEAAAGRT